jgi:DNA primase
VSDPIPKPSIVAVLRGLAPHIELDEETHGWKPVRCPFHDDRAASGSYNTAAQRFRCHGCGIAGDGYDVIQEVERCGFATARARAAEFCGSAFTIPDADAAPQRSKLTSRRTKDRAKLVRKKHGRRR